MTHIPIVRRDKFEPEENVHLEIPCCWCRHRHGLDTEEPCRTCDHSATAVEETDHEPR